MRTRRRRRCPQLPRISARRPSIPDGRRKGRLRGLPRGGASHDADRRAGHRMRRHHGAHAFTRPSMRSDTSSLRVRFRIPAHMTAARVSRSSRGAVPLAVTMVQQRVRTLTATGAAAGARRDETAGDWRRLTRDRPRDRYRTPPCGSRSPRPRRTPERRAPYAHRRPDPRETPRPTVGEPSGARTMRPGVWRVQRAGGRTRRECGTRWITGPATCILELPARAGRDVSRQHHAFCPRPDAA